MNSEFKVCVFCNKKLPITDFEWSKNRPNPRKICKKCRSKRRWNTVKNDKRALKEHNLKRRNYYENNKEKIQTINERSKYGISRYDLGIKECEICGSTERLCIDHDYKTGEVRGLLCNRCNFALGFINDDMNLIENSIKYIEEYYREK